MHARFPSAVRVFMWSSPEISCRSSKASSACRSEPAKSQSRISTTASRSCDDAMSKGSSSLDAASTASSCARAPSRSPIAASASPSADFDLSVIVCPAPKMRVCASTTAASSTHARSASPMHAHVRKNQRKMLPREHSRQVVLAKEPLFKRTRLGESGGGLFERADVAQHGSERVLGRHHCELEAIVPVGRELLQQSSARRNDSLELSDRGGGVARSIDQNCDELKTRREGLRMFVPSNSPTNSDDVLQHGRRALKVRGRKRVPEPHLGFDRVVMLFTERALLDLRNLGEHAYRTLNVPKHAKHISKL
eukprot:Amastigsp_a177064_33.p1 type:complete len:308 gc:universal Amastigsp_a177064_33:487-1410(+)